MSFTQDAVLLERREGLDWQPLGRAPFSEGNVAAKLNALRGDDAGPSSEPDTVLVIPDDQILYTRLTASPGSDVPAAIARALEGMTPYKAEELAFDWCPDEDGRIDSLRVAAVARKTLQEAEDFARIQGFRPSGFLARPGDERFDGQPDFGASELARQERAVSPFSSADLQQVGITSERIEIPEPVTQQPVISRIPPHYFAPAPTIAEVADTPEPRQEVAAAAPQTEEAEGKGGYSGPVAPKVIRHGEAAPAGLSPHAKAIHTRAAEARQKQAASGDTGSAKAGGLLQTLQNLQDSAPSTLTVLTGLLVVIMLAAFLFLGGSQDHVPQTAETPAPRTQTDEMAGADTEAKEQVPPAAPDVQAAAGSQAGAAEQDLPAGAATDSDALPEEASQQSAAADGPTDNNSASATPGDVPQDALTAALTEAMRDSSAAQQATADAEPGAGTAERETTSETSPRVLQGEAAQIIAGQAVERAVASSPAETPEPTGTTQDTATEAAASPSDTQGLSNSPRPPRAAPQRTQAPASSDRRPVLPTDPQPYEQRAEPEPPRLTGRRPPSRPATANRSTTPAAAPAPASVEPASQPAPATTPTTARSAAPASSPRPPSRPDNLTLLEEGSISEDGAGTRLTRSERLFLEGLLQELRTAQAGAAGLSEAEHGAVILLAQARPQRRPVAVAGPTEDAVRAAVATAMSSSERPAPRADNDAGTGDDATATGSVAGGLAGLERSGRPATRPGSVAARAGSGSDPGNPSLSRDAIEDAIATAVDNSTASPGAVALTALTSSAIPPRRGDATPSAPTADDLREAAKEQQAEQEREAALAEQRRLDAELQAQAEARARERAAADARAEAQARAAAEARARAQAEAEARAAAAQQQRYVPPEAEKEPEVANQVPAGRTPASVASAATVEDGIRINRTQIIGTIGAGKASRALVRLSNGRVITLRLGDKINGGQITEIGNSKITYVEGGQAKQLSVLSGQ
ncbi:hypothetical protein C9E81_05680 [Paracoccus alkanivorans]|uniref:Translation initiation factor 2 n=2 Tax=Paracoccus alkanivorans TaxID=2116655 RepID=A0A3M0MFL9_9RHOB|nr:hypothetical protein C9E81_05680 [Paracoccus alkanivorans]